jgi:hypothetical protein
MTGMLLRRVKAARPGADRDDDYEVIDGDGLVIGRIFKSSTSRSWIWTLFSKDHEDRGLPHGYTATREAAIAASAKSWRRD